MECAICLDEISGNTGKIVLPCKHEFHIVALAMVTYKTTMPVLS